MYDDSICSGSKLPTPVPTIPPTIPYLNNVWNAWDIYYFILIEVIVMGTRDAYKGVMRDG